MRQTKFHYKVGYTDKLRLEDIENLDFVEEVNSYSEIEEEGGGKRCSITVELSKPEDSERLHNVLKNMYEWIWFDF